MNDNDPIIHNIENIGNQRLLGCLLKWAMMFIVGAIALTLAMVAAPNQSFRATAAFAFTGLVLGAFSASFLTAGARRFLLVTFVTVPIVITLAMFVMRTILGHIDQYPLRLVISPLFLSAGFVVGQVRMLRL